MARSTEAPVAREGGRVRIRSAFSTRTWVALGAQVLLVLASAACSRTRRPLNMVWANEPGYGRVATCPEDAVDARGGLAGFGDRTPSPMEAKCSYQDAAGPITQLVGRVLAKGEAADLPEPVAGVPVLIHRVREEDDGGPALGPVVAETTTDPQGGWSLSASLPAGDYIVVVPGDEPGEILARRPLKLVGQGARKVEELEILVPLPQPLWEGEPAEPPLD